AFTVVYDGEIYLDDGPTTLVLAADDDAFFDIDLGAIQPTLRAHVNDTPLHTLTITPPAAGWYPVRGAMSEGGGNAAVVLGTLVGSTGTPISADHMRARVTSAPGAMVVAASDPLFETLQPGSSIEPTLVDTTWQYAPPTYDLFGIGGSQYALRYSAQLRIETS